MSVPPVESLSSVTSPSAGPAGAPAHPSAHEADGHGGVNVWRLMAWRTLGCVVASLAAWALHDSLPSISTGLFMVAYLFGAWDLAREVWEDALEWRFDTHFLMLLVVPCTAALGAWGEGALLLILFSLSTTLETFALGKTRRAIGALLRGAPKTAIVIDGDATADIAVDNVMPGMRIRVMPGQSVPVDLQVLEGETACDESSITGESVPIAKKAGDQALSGTLNLWGVIEGRALRAASDSTLHRIVRLIEEAQASRSPSQRLAERFGSRYTLFVLAACTLFFLWCRFGAGLPAFFQSGGNPSAFYRAMTLMVVLSPCALVVSVPAAILSAIAFGARRGILFRDGNAIEKLARVTVVALDKTGTLTEGRLSVESVELFAGTQEELLAHACALSRLSTHPISRAVTASCIGRRVPELSAEAVQNVAGKGMFGTVGGRRVAIGSRTLAMEMLAQLPFDRPLPVPQGVTEMWVVGDGLLGRLFLRDTIRPEAPALLEQMHSRGLRTIMLTGDGPAAAAAIAEKAPVSMMRSGLKPEDKVAAIQELRREGEIVAMIGDGVNDAPSLAAADVSMAMGMRGSDAAIEQADIVLMKDRLEHVLTARELSLRVQAIMRQNIAISLGVMGVMAVVTIFQTSLPLFLGVVMHEGSTALVVLNGLRLLLDARRPAGPTGGDQSPRPLKPFIATLAPVAPLPQIVAHSVISHAPY